MIFAVSSFCPSPSAAVCADSISFVPDCSTITVRPFAPDSNTVDFNMIFHISNYEREQRISHNIA